MLYYLGTMYMLYFYLLNCDNPAREVSQNHFNLNKIIS